MGKRVHIGHHFFGAGNLGDDLMLAGFLSAASRQAPDVRFTCCVPWDRERLTRLFPQVLWLPYDDAARVQCVNEADTWLGLGGAPWQTSISRWFIDHLEQERQHCLTARKPMFFLGVGGQDTDAFALPETTALCQQARRIWTRDTLTAEKIAGFGSGVAVEAAADLAHVFLSDLSFEPPVSGRLGLALNFDFKDWPGLKPFLAALLERRGGDERRPYMGESVSQILWLVQESRSLPASERDLHAKLPEDLKPCFPLTPLENASADRLQRLLAWPGCGRVMTSRFHTSLIAAWAGAAVVVLASNQKLKAAASDCYLPVVEPQTDPATSVETLLAATPLPASRLQMQKNLAEASCKSFFKSL